MSARDQRPGVFPPRFDGVYVAMIALVVIAIAVTLIQRGCARDALAQEAAGYVVLRHPHRDAWYQLTNAGASTLLLARGDRVDVADSHGNVRALYLVRHVTLARIELVPGIPPGLSVDRRGEDNRRKPFAGYWETSLDDPLREGAR